MKIILELTEEQIEQLKFMLDMTDKGPVYDGWQSDVLVELKSVVKTAITEARKQKE